MIRVVSARGVPGALGAVVRAPDGRRCAVTCYHVLYGDGPREPAPVWALERPIGGKPVALGVSAGGYIGRVTDEGRVAFIDCGLVALDQEAESRPAIRDTLLALAQVTGVKRAARGDRVSKRGPLTGVTQGAVVDIAHHDAPHIDGRRWEAPGQLRIRPHDPEAIFSAPGESGAAVVDEEGRLTGFLWGANPSGEGIASPATAALAHLGLTLERGAP